MAPLLLASRWTPFSVVAIVSALVLIYVVTRFQTVAWLPELTVYRIGNAVSLLFNEKDYIRPVQGLPIALLSKGIVWVLLPFLPIISTQAISIYMGVYFGAVICVAASAILLSWPKLSGPQRAGVMLLFVCPWLLGGAPFDLITEPDYWVGEWSYLIISACLLAAVPNMSPWVTGAWIAVGMAMKITLIGIAALFVLASQDRSAKSLAIFFASFVATFILIDIAYIGDFLGGIRLLKFQLNFFAHPNDSIMFTSVLTVLLARPFLIGLGVACIVALVTSPARWFEKIAAAAWLCGFVYLIFRRPHDTSIASAATATTFLMVYFARTWGPLSVVAMIIICGTVASSFERTLWIVDIIKNGHKSQSITSSLPKISGMIFQPDNYWNAGLAVQAFGYNGELGYYYPIANNPDGSSRYVIGGKAFQALFPGVIMIADDSSHLAVAERALRFGTPIWWTRQDPVQPNSTPGSLDRLNAIIQRAGAKVESFPIVVDGHPWLLQKAQK